MKAVLTDIEGTTSAISFVKERLFPFSREQMPAFVAERGEEPEVLALLNEARAWAGRLDSSNEDLVALLIRWIDEDKKAPALKSIQGMIWAEGYASGALRGHVYPDAAAGLRRWHAAGLVLAVFSSGSVEAQKLIFRYSTEGDLAPLFSAHFDTRTGPKNEQDAYSAIASALRLSSSEILFLSDVPAELEAAARAGLRGALIARGSEPATDRFPVFTHFDGLDSLVQGGLCEHSY